MPGLAVADRIRETSQTTGTGDYSLLGAATGFQAFSVLGANNLTPYFATDDINYEVGIGTVLTGPARLSRTTILASSNGGAAVNWGAGTRDIICGLPAALAFPRKLTKSVAGGAGSTTLTENESSYSIIEATGALTGNRNLVVTDSVRPFIVYNNTSGAFSLTVKTAAGSGVVVTQGRRTALACDGVNVVSAVDDLASPVIQGSLWLTGILSPAQITATQNNYATGTATVIRLSTNASQDITGLASGSNGRLLCLENIGSFPVVLKNESASSTAANRLALGRDVTIPAGQSVVLWYDSTSSRWRAFGDISSEIPPTAIATGRKIGVLGAYASAAIIVITADELVLKDSSGAAFLAEAVNVSPSLATAGANGLDTGAEAASTWYYAWVIYNPTTGTVAGLFSTSATAPTMPAGYTYKALVSAAYNDGSSNIIPYQQTGRQIAYRTFRNLVTNGGAVAETAIALTAFVPAIAHDFRIHVRYLGATGSGAGRLDSTLSLRHVTGINFAQVAFDFQAVGVSVVQYMPGPVIDIPNNGLTLYYLQAPISASAPIATLDCLGFSLPIGGE
jgi:hypothetical protein